jgi:GxxExxY protein
VFICENLCPILPKEVLRKDSLIAVFQFYQAGILAGKHVELMREIIGSFYDVYNNLGYGFLEKVYENALFLELCKKGLQVEQQKPIQVFYHQHVIGEYFADLVVDSKVIVEIKAVRTLVQQHEAQLLNYLKASTYEVGLLLNFGPQAQRKRKVYNNERKPNLQK